jgi:hypothetical protein
MRDFRTQFYTGCRHIFWLDQQLFSYYDGQIVSISYLIQLVLNGKGFAMRLCVILHSVNNLRTDVEHLEIGPKEKKLDK